MTFPSIYNSKLLYHSRIKRGQEIYIIFLLCFLVKSKLGGHAYVLPENHSHRVFRKECAMCQRGRGHWVVYYTGSQSFVIKLAYQLWGLWFVGLLSWMTKPLIVIYRRVNFVFHNWECTLIYRPLSFPFRSL